MLLGERFPSRVAVASPRPHPTRGELSDRGERAARTAQPIELSLRSPQITPPGVMPGWCAGRPGAATSMTRRTAPGGGSAHIPGSVAPLAEMATSQRSEAELLKRGRHD